MKMELSRLDTIVSNNVMFSENKSEIQQAVYILQDISATLAMIYDKMCEEKPLEGDKNG